MMATAFLGQTLPYGSMSYWGGTVITSMFSAIPQLGNDLVVFIWGGYSISNATLTRFYALHLILPFILVGAVIIHLIFLHASGSNNPLGISTYQDKLPFHPYYIYKDILGFMVLFLFYIILITYLPNYLGHTDNYIEADSLVTPPTIVPEFYFLAFYAILRAIPNKLLGVVVMLQAILALLILPFNVNNSFITSNSFRPIAKVAQWIFAANFLLLTRLGGVQATSTNVLLSQICTALYFAYLTLSYSYWHSHWHWYWDSYWDWERYWHWYWDWQSYWDWHRDWHRY